MDAPFVGRIRGKGRGKGRDSREFFNSSSRPPDPSEQAGHPDMQYTRELAKSSSSDAGQVETNVKYEVVQDILSYLRRAVTGAEVTLEHSDKVQKGAQTNGAEFIFVMMLPGAPCEDHMKDALHDAEAALVLHGATGTEQQRPNRGKFIRAELKGTRFTVFVGGSEADRLFGRARGKGLPHTDVSRSSRASGTGPSQFWKKMGLEPGQRLQDHCVEILASARPAGATERLRREVFQEMRDLISATLVAAECILVGSVARQTDLCLTSDIDIILLLPGTPADEQVRDAMGLVESALLGHGARGIDGQRLLQSATNIRAELHGVAFDIVAGGREVDVLADRPPENYIIAHKMLAHNDLFKPFPRSVRMTAVLLKWWLRDALAGASSKMILELLACFAGRQLSSQSQSGDDTEVVVQIFVEVARLLTGWRDLQVTWDHPSQSWKPYHASRKPLIIDVYDPAENVASHWTPALWQQVARLAQDALQVLSD